MESKWALITGASSGIGKELAYLHAQKGDNLILIARNLRSLEEIQQDIEASCRVKVLIFSLDLSDNQSPLNLYTEIKHLGIVPDYLINNAGFGQVGYFHEIPDNVHLNMINLNVTALTLITRYFIPDMIKKGGGRILLVSSTASLLPGPKQAVYFATKAYVTSLGYALYQELKKHGISVTTLLPGATKTDFGRVSGMDKTKLFATAANAFDVAKAGFEGMLKGKRKVIAGVPIYMRVFLPLLPLIPTSVILKIVDYLQTPKN